MTDPQELEVSFVYKKGRLVAHHAAIGNGKVPIVPAAGQRWLFEPGRRYVITVAEIPAGLRKRVAIGYFIREAYESQETSKTQTVSGKRAAELRKAGVDIRLRELHLDKRERRLAERERKVADWERLMAAREKATQSRPTSKEPRHLIEHSSKPAKAGQVEVRLRLSETELLGLKPGEAREGRETAYRRLMQFIHPDHFSQAPSWLHDLAEAITKRVNEIVKR